MHWLLENFVPLSGRFMYEFIRCILCSRCYNQSSNHMAAQHTLSVRIKPRKSASVPNSAKYPPRQASTTHAVARALHSRYSLCRDKGMVASNAVHRRCESRNIRGLRPVRRHLSSLPLTDIHALNPSNRFGNRYFENLNAEQEVPGIFYSVLIVCIH